MLAAAHGVEVAAQSGTGRDEPGDQDEYSGEIDHQRRRI